MRPLVIASDLDGTLLRSDSTLSDRTRAALRAVRAAGLRVVAATARPPRVIEEIFGSDDLLDVAICGNGTVFYDPATKVVDLRHPLPAALLHKVISTIQKLVPGAGFAIETGAKALYEPNYLFRPTLDQGRFPVGHVNELFGEPTVKLMVWLPSREPAAEWSKLSPLLGDEVECSWSSPHAPFEIVVSGVTKASALTELAQEWNIEPTRVVAFGDAYNDVPMLEWAGTSYAVANAALVVRAAASYHAPSNDEDGVAQILESLVAPAATPYADA